VLDSRKFFSNWRAEEIFYRTDHHWRIEAAFHIAEAVLQRVGKRMVITEEFHTLSFPNSFLGSLGVKAGKYFEYCQIMFATLDSCIDLRLQFFTQNKSYEIIIKTNSLKFI